MSLYALNSSKLTRLLLPVILGLGALNPLSLAVANSNEASLFEEIDAEAETRRLAAKYDDDKQRLSSAIQNTKDLIRKSQSKAYLPELYLRLAELYIEISRVSYMQVRLLQGPEADASDFSALESKNYKLQAVEIYQRILNVYPKFLERDKVHFYLAHEFKELAREEDMLAQYERLIEEHPTSPLAPEALLLTGDYYFGKAETKQSQDYYEQVIEYTGNPAAVIARYKLAWVHINLKDYKTAVALLVESIKDANTQKERDVDTYDGLDIRLESLVDLAFVYPDAYKDESPRHALEFFRELSWSRTSYITVLEKAASRLRVKQHWPRVLELYRELIKLENDPEQLIEYSHQLFDAYQKADDARQEALPGSEADIQMLVRALRLQSASIYIDEEVKQESEQIIEEYSRDIATSIHQKAKASNKQEDYERAALAYEAYLSWFDNNEHTLQMQLNLADSFYNSGDYFNAAIAYEKVTEQGGVQGEEQGDLLYSALHAYQASLKSPEPMNHLHTLQARSGLVATGRQYLASFPDSKYSRDVEFNIAWVRYDEGKFDEAILGFSEFLQKYPTGDTATAAVELVIDSYQITEDWQGLHEFTEMAAAIPQLPQAEKDNLNRLASAAQEKIVSSMTIAALDDWDNGADEMLKFANENPSAALGAQALGSLMALSQEKHDLRTLSKATDNLIVKAPQSESANTGVKMMIDASLKSGSFRMLQENLGLHAMLYPNEQDSKAFLYQSAKIQQQLGMNDAAIASFESYRKSYAPAGSELADVTLSIAETQINNGDEKDAVATLMDSRKQLSAAQRADIDALAGLLLVEQGNYQTAGLIAQSMAKNATGNSLTNRRLAQLQFNVSDASLKAYNSLNLSKGIDGAIVQQKTERLQQLSQSYQQVLNYQSPKWSAAALYRLAAINNEYASFLLNAPIPNELSDAEKQQYADLIAQQAAPYQQESENYQTAAKDLVERLGLLDKKLHNFGDGNSRVTAAIPVNSYNKGKAVSADTSITDEELYQLHQQLIANQSNETALLDLVHQYYLRGDLAQALLLATQYSQDASSGTQSRLMNIAGVVHFYQGNIEAAQAAFTQAIELTPSNLNAIANLASLYAEYDATTQAQQGFAKLPADWQVPLPKYACINLVAKHYNNFKQTTQSSEVAGL
ncbi:tetratricopeptide repeat protein [Reinekea marinisedimentorum]|uniref:Tetratricopeptide repeat protein n=1 Tax=Reinekea marinisedimentorum TaxID=230495 RepID=A0A4V2UJI5_9GAMM|nr:tetratricopeptide repeat protein [Reinekea marinisedimentorum]TCS40222.1 tetratricopeptide repeat protein [Reinekea marinisedimentorum]